MSPPSPQPPGQPQPSGTGTRAGASQLRADARRNRARVLAAAEAVFTARGTDASTEEVAREAGVGIGTVFRHFPTKEALLEAVFAELLQRVAEEASARSSAEDPGAAFFEFFTEMVQRSATKQALAAALTAAGVDVQRHTVPQAEPSLRGALETLLARAQQSGAVREDVRVGDLIALLVGASRAAEHAGWDRGVVDRVLAVILAGLRPATAGR